MLSVRTSLLNDTQVSCLWKTFIPQDNPHAVHYRLISASDPVLYTHEQRNTKQQPIHQHPR